MRLTMQDGALEDTDRGVVAWSTTEWREQAVAWLDDRLEMAGIARVGEVEQLRVRPWATVLKAQTTSGTFWFKAVAQHAAFEVALYPVLSRIASDAVITPLATDVARGWMVLPYGGSHLGDLVTGDALVEAMMTVLPRYAVLQRALESEVESLVRIRVIDMRAGVLPERFEEALEASSAFVQQRGSAEEREILSKLVGLRPGVLRWSQQLAASPGFATIDHNDLHPWNVLVPDEGAMESARIYDWGDSVISHPFASMLSPQRFLRDRLGISLDDERQQRVRDAYLELFRDFGTPAELESALCLACHLANVSRSVVWVRALAMQAQGQEHPNAAAPFRWLTNLLDLSWLGHNTSL